MTFEQYWEENCCRLGGSALVMGRLKRKREARWRVACIRRAIEQAQLDYYNDRPPTVDDYEFDALLEELAGIEKLYPELATATSWTRAMIGPRHYGDQLSFDDKKRWDDAAEWFLRRGMPYEVSVKKVGPRTIWSVHVSVKHAMAWDKEHSCGQWMT